MLIDYESIIILDGQICSDIVSGKVTADIFQCTKIKNADENSFIKNNSVIQCISSSDKLKFSVMYKTVPSLFLSEAKVVFSSGAECGYEIRCHNETIADGTCIMNGFSINPSETDGKLDFVFIKEEEEKTDVFINETEMIMSENILSENELNELERKLSEEKEKNREILARKNEILSELENLKSEVSMLENSLDEYDDIKSRYAVLKENSKENDLNSEKIQKVVKQLECFNDILSYYKNEDGYISVADKISMIIQDAEIVKEHISEFASKRKQETESILDELDI